MTNYLLYMLLVFLCMRRSDAMIRSPETEVLGATTPVVIPANTEKDTASNQQSNVTDRVVVPEENPLKHANESPEKEVPGSPPTVLDTLPIAIPSEHVPESPETEVSGSSLSALTTPPVTIPSEHITESPETEIPGSSPKDLTTLPITIPSEHRTESLETEVNGSSPTDITTPPVTTPPEYVTRDHIQHMVSDVTEAPETEVPDFSPTIPPTSLTKEALNDTTVKEVGNYSGTVTDRVTLSDAATDFRFGAGDGNSTSSGNVTDNVTTDAPKPAISNPYAIINKGSVSKKQYETCSLVINIILKPVVCVGGVVMNIIGVCVLLQKRFRRSTYTYLCFLAFSDIFLLLCTIIRTIPKIVIYYDDILANYIDMHIFPYENIFLSSTFTRISEYIICAMAIERFVAVLKPMKVRDLFLCRHALAVCIGISVFCVLFHVPYLFVYYPKPYFNPSRNTTMYALGKYPWFSDSGIRPVFDPLYETIFIYVPILILVTCNAGILIRTHKRNRQRQDIVANDGICDKMSKEQRKITLTLLIISLFFLSVLIPLACLTITQKFNKNIRIFGREHYLVYVMVDVLALGWNINSANDFIVYIYTSNQFKNSLTALICRKKVRKLDDSPNNANSSDTLSTQVGSVAIEMRM